MKILPKWLSFRNRTQPVTGIIVHATAGRTVIGSLETLIAKGLSYHYIIDRDGTVTKCVPLSKVAFHAGVSFGWGGANCNGYTVGISLANLDDGKEKITEAQYEALIDLIDDICVEYDTIKWLSSHYGIAPKRKSDPRQLDFDRVKMSLQRKLVLYNTRKPF